MWQIIVGVLCIVLAVPISFIAIGSLWSALSMIGESSGGDYSFGGLFKAIAWGGALLGGIAAISLLTLSYLAFTAGSPQPQGFDAWLAEHEKTCQQCREEEAICVPAFKKMQAMLREGTY